MTEWVENDLVQIVSDEGGTIWETVFTVTLAAEQTELILTMDAKSYKLLSKLMNFFIMGMIKTYRKRDGLCEGILRSELR